MTAGIVWPAIPVTKADRVRQCLGTVAEMRLNKATWPEVAAVLQADGLSVTADEIRSYWGRHTKGMHPAQVALRARDARIAALIDERDADRAATALERDTEARQAEYTAAVLAQTEKAWGQARDEVAQAVRKRDAAIAAREEAERIKAALEARLTTLEEQLAVERTKARLLDGRLIVVDEQSGHFIIEGFTQDQSAVVNQHWPEFHPLLQARAAQQKQDLTREMETAARHERADNDLRAVLVSLARNAKLDTLHGQLARNVLAASPLVREVCTRLAASAAVRPSPPPAGPLSSR
ncbi:hypothetical protein GBZ26_26845 [Azospirillum formosense]|uniref:KfrA N-terminal DNA-binding domain-containing protein n=2 Tax=Azospirillum formosense TaxID=861533 RepID=A0ABX2L1K8_9PROT|nr:hypothetical protein [Azospirillum formosense]NUB22779.1 hypothetical protein [Azospirillum formosense]